MRNKEISRIKKNIKGIMDANKPFKVASKLIERIEINIKLQIQKLINRNYELVGSDINSDNGNDIFIFKDGDKRFAVEVYEWVE